MKTNKIIKQIDLYISGELNEKEKLQVEEAIKNDPEYKEIYRLQKEIGKALDDEELKDYREYFGRIYEEKYGKETSRKLSKKQIYAIAAFIFLLLSIGTVLIVQINRDTLNENLFEKYYSTYTFPNYRSVKLVDINNAEALFKEASYQKALALAEDIIKQSPKNIEAKFIAAQSLMELKAYEKAVLYFDLVLSSDKLALKEYAEWYKALALLKIGDTPKAKLLFLKIKVSGNKFSEGANKILKSLEQ